MTLKIEAGKKYRTRGGDEVEVLRTGINSIDSVVGVITCKRTGDQSAICFVEDGSYFRGDEHTHDLVSEIRPKRTVWLNVYPGRDEWYVHKSREKADAASRLGDDDECRTACIRVSFEEGQFDD